MAFCPPALPSRLLAFALLLSLVLAPVPLMADPGGGATAPAADVAPRRVATAEEARELRSFLRELVAGTSEIRASTADDVRRVLARHPEVLRWVLEGRDLESIVAAADLEGLVAPSGLKDLVPAASPSGLALKLGDTTEDSRFALLKQVEDSHFFKLAQETQVKVAAVELHQTQAVRMLSNPRAELGMTDETLATLMEKVMSPYFRDLDRLDKTRLIVAQLELPPRASAPAKMSAMLQNSGPCMQKLFQLIGRDVKNSQFASSMLSLQSEIRPFPGLEATAAIESSLGKPVTQLFQSFNETPLAAASIGQVHLAELADGQKIVVKVRRPRIMEIATREIAGLLAASSKEPAAHELLKKVSQTVLEELNFRNEARNVAMGLAYERPSLGIGIAGQIAGFDAHEDVIISRLAPGARISKGIAGAGDAALRAKAMAALLDTWFDEVLFGRGFFHGDLHPGNIFFEATPGSAPGYRLTLIDFGNAGVLSLDERRAFLELVLAAQTPRPDRVLEIFGRLGRVPPEKRELLTAAFSHIYASESDITKRLDQFLMVSLENGMEIPSSFLSFNRARLFLEKELLSLGETLDRLDPLRKLPRYSAQRIYQRVALKRISVSLFQGLLRREAPATPIVAPGTLLNALRDYLGHRGREIGNGCSEAFGDLVRQMAAP